MISFQCEEKKPRVIVQLLKREGISASVMGVTRFLKRHSATGSIERKKGSGRKPKVTDIVKEMVEKEMQTDDENTVSELQTKATKSATDIACMLNTSGWLAGYLQWGPSTL